MKYYFTALLMFFLFPFAGFMCAVLFKSVVLSIYLSSIGMGIASYFMLKARNSVCKEENESFIKKSSVASMFFFFLIGLCIFLFIVATNILIGSI